MTNATSENTCKEKRLLRKAVLARRNGLDPITRAQKSHLICDELSRLFDSAQSASLLEAKVFTVAIYYAFGSEVDLDVFARHIWRRGGQVAFPCMEKIPETPADRRISRMVMRLVSREAYEQHTRAFDVKSEGDNTTGSREVAVPFFLTVAKAFASDEQSLAAFMPIDPAHIDMVVVPLVAFDDNFGRLGYGGGNYDEFLPALSDSALVVGVGFEEQRVQAVPREPHDLTLPRIISA